MTSETRFARVAGIGYAAIFALALHANVSVLGAALSADNPESLLRFVQEQAGAIRLATAELFVVMAADVLIAWALYRLFERAMSPLNALSALFRLVYTVAQIGVVLHLPTAVRLASTEMGDTAIQSMLVAEEGARYYQGFSLTLLFFGIHLVLLGVLIVGTRRIPAAIGLLVALAGLAYLGDGLGLLLFPELQSANPTLSTLALFVPALLGEGLLTLWLLFGPIKTDRPQAAQARDDDHE